MITHVALYRFKPDLSEGSVDGFASALCGLTEETALSSHFAYGPHVPLPADKEVAKSVYSFAAVWEFDRIEAMDEFSRHPAVAEFERRWVRPLLSELAIANYEHPHHMPGEEPTRAAG